VYRFMAKMKNLGAVEVVLFNFLRNAIQSGKEASFENLLQKLAPLEKNKLESRAFMYLDIIAWLESKILHVPVQEVRRRRFQEGKRK